MFTTTTDQQTTCSTSLTPDPLPSASVYQQNEAVVGPLAAQAAGRLVQEPHQPLQQADTRKHLSSLLLLLLLLQCLLVLLQRQHPAQSAHGQRAGCGRSLGRGQRSPAGAVTATTRGGGAVQEQHLRVLSGSTSGRH